MAEQTSIGMLIQPKLDPKFVKTLDGEIKSLQKRLSAVKIDWREIGKEAKISLQDLGKLTKSFDNLHKSAEKIAGLSDSLKEAEKQAEKLKTEYAEAGDSVQKEKIGKEYGKVMRDVGLLRNAVKQHKDALMDDQQSLSKHIKAYHDHINKLKESASYSPKQNVKDVYSSVAKGFQQGFKGDVLGGLKTSIGGIGEAAKKGSIAVSARKELGGGAAGGAASDALGGISKAAAGITMAVGAFAAFWQIIKQVDGRYKDLNKTLLVGSTLAGDAGRSSEDYSKAIGNLRDSSIAARSSLISLGVSSEQSLKIISAYSQSASGSITQTSEQLKRMGGDNLDKGVREFTKNAIVYGKALGMEGDEVAATMGNWVSEVGISTNNITKMMSGIVEMAATANMPVSKFMDIFRQVTPSVDLYINRLEELTGTVKLLSATMSPKDVKSFMDAFSRGFDQIDFKQRLKMALIVGPKKVNKRLSEDFADTGDAIASQLAEHGLGDKFKKAMEAQDPVGAVRDVVGEAMAKGVSGAVIGDAQKLARSKKALGRGEKGDVLQTATAMRGAGVFARMDILKEYAGKFTGGDISGMGEHVAKSLGVSEQEYKAILQLEDSMGGYMSSLKKVGRTGNVSINNNLKKLLHIDRKQFASDEEFEKAFEDTMSNMDPKQQEKMVRKASAMQIGEDQSNAESMEDLATQQINETMSVSDKIDNVIGYWLDKIASFLGGPITSAMTGLLDIALGNKDKAVANKQLGLTADLVKKGSKFSEEQTAQIDGVTNQLKDLMSSGASSTDIVNKMSSFLTPEVFSGKGIGESEFKGLSEKLKSSLGDESTNLISAMQTGRDDIAKKIISGLDPDKAVQAMQDISIAFTKSGHVQKEFSDSTQKDKDRLKGRGKKLTSKEKAAIKDERTEKKYDELNGVVAPITQVAAALSQVKEGQAATFSPDNITSSSSKIAGVTENQTKLVVDGQTELVQSQDDASEHIYDGIKDVAGILKKGIRYEKSWMGSQYKNFLKETTLESFSQALTEFAVLSAKLDETPALKAELAKQGSAVLASGGKFGAKDIMGVTDPTKLSEAIDKVVKGSRQMGGPIPDAGLYNLHKGEYVLPAAAAAGGGKGGGGSVVVNMTINGANMTPQEFKSAVVQVMSDVARRQ